MDCKGIDPIKPTQTLGHSLGFGILFLPEKKVIDIDNCGAQLGDPVVSLKQMPSCLMLKSCLDTPAYRNYEELVKQGVPLVYQTRKGEVVDINPPVHGSNASDYTASIESYLSGGQDNILSNRKVINKPPKNSVIKVDYQDVWRIFRHLAYCDYSGQKKPKLTVVSSSSIRLIDPIPPAFLTKETRERVKRSKEFTRLSAKDQMNVIIKRTHWGVLLQKWIDDDIGGRRNIGIRLKQRIFLLLSGQYPPEIKTRWNTLFKGPHKKADPRTRSFRFLEMLKTVDGIFIQRFLTMPYEMWDWKQYDTYVLKNIIALIDDEFLDGPCLEKTLKIETAFERLKKRRKKAKQSLLRGRAPPEVNPGWLEHFDIAEKQISKMPRDAQLHAIANLVQTRGCGTPPPIVSLKAKMKFLRIISEPCKPLDKTKENLIKAATDKFIRDVPAGSFTGLTTKARITVSASACWEKTRAEGGTIRALNELVSQGLDGVTCPVRDLNTGAITEYRLLHECDSIGTYVFWMCLHKCMTTDIDELTSAYVTVVAEPGKSRTVTKASACLKVVLDMVSKICSYPLSKVESSESGMGMDSHGWNFFMNMFSTFKEEVFRVSNIEVSSESKESTVETHTFCPVYVSSSDLSTATDFMSHKVARILARRWMNACGIPPFLSGFVMKTCFKPRWIHFKGVPPFDRIGESTGTQSRRILLVRGVMMGDPLTKPIMHLVHAVNRQIPGLEAKDLAGLFSNPREMEERLKSPMSNK